MIRNSFFASNSEKLNFDSSLLFDRVINLKFITEKPTDTIGKIVNDEYVIRSDFEVVYNNFNFSKVMGNSIVSGKNYYFRRCQHKPSIKVQYKQVSGGTNTEIDIFVSNFFLMDKDGNCIQNFDFANNKLSQVEIMMGYFGQFKKTFNPDLDDMLKYMTFEPTVDIDKITMRNVEYATFDKLPPDSVLHIHGFVGNISSKSLDNENEYITFSSLEAEGYTLDLSNKTYKEIFNTLITRRFLKNAVVDALSKDPETAKSIVFNNKLLNEADAKRYGIQVKLDDKLSTLKFEAKPDAEGNTVSNTITLDRGETSLKSMNSICQKLNPNLRFCMLNNGNFFVYLYDKDTKVETLNSSLADVYTNAFAKRGGILPAVTNINTSPVASITCPFYGFLEPFQDFIFKTRYSLTNMITYYSGIEIKEYKFYAISVYVSFATVEDINEMNIKATLKKV